MEGEGRRGGEKIGKAERIGFRSQRLAGSTSLFSNITWKDLVSPQIAGGQKL